MDDQLLGGTEVAVTTLGFGAAVIGGLFAAVDDETAEQALQAAWDSGVRYFDTAPHYGAGLSEVRLGRFLAGRPRNEFTVSTKVGRTLVPTGSAEPLDGEGFVEGLPNIRVMDYSADAVHAQLEASLERLGLDAVDVVFIHDPDDHWQEALEGAYPALAALRDGRAVGAIGVGMNQWQMPARFVRECDLDAVMLAGRYTLLDQSSDAELLPLCQARGVSVVAAGAFNSGLLADPRPGAHYDYEAAPAALLERALELKDLCAQYQVPLAAAAAQFPLRHPAVSSVVLGARNASQAVSGAELMSYPIPDQLWESLAAAGVRVPGAQR